VKKLEIEQVIKVLNSFVEPFKSTLVPVCKSALEKQVSKEVDESMLNYSKLPVERCPICASSGISPYKDRYCYNCGQKLKWDKEEPK
jgi:hypothetical protein